MLNTKNKEKDLKGSQKEQTSYKGVTFTPAAVFNGKNGSQSQWNYYYYYYFKVEWENNFLPTKAILQEQKCKTDLWVNKN